MSTRFQISQFFHSQGAVYGIPLVILWFLLSWPRFAAAQVSQGGTPPSFSASAALRSAPAAIEFAPLDVSALLAIDELEADDVPLRFGVAIAVDYSPQYSGQWDILEDGSRIWRLALHCAGATSINLIYENFYLPHGAELFVYAADRSTVIGAFTEENNNPGGGFATMPIPGEHCVLEYIESAGLLFEPDFRLVSVIHGYRNVFGAASEWDREVGDSESPCKRNINCMDPTDPQFVLKRSVAMILIGDGQRICSGSLVTSLDPNYPRYLLTAHHCLVGSLENWIFAFNYECPDCVCAPFQDYPWDQTVGGALLRAASTHTDFALVEINHHIPASYGVVYNGWDRVGWSPASPILSISHPLGDIKQYAVENDFLETSSDLRYWLVRNWEVGQTRKGSSGSPLFNSQNRVIGQLSRGNRSGCRIDMNNRFGMIYSSWNTNPAHDRQLAHWLDPLGEGIIHLELRYGFDADAPGIMFERLRSIDHDSIFQVGFNFQMVADLRNMGISANEVRAKLRSNTPGVTIPDSLGTWPDMGTDSLRSNTTDTFTVAVSAPLTPGAMVNFTLIISAAGGYTATRTYSLRLYGGPNLHINPTFYAQIVGSEMQIRVRYSDLAVDPLGRTVYLEVHSGINEYVATFVPVQVDPSGYETVFSYISDREGVDLLRAYIVDALGNRRYSNIANAYWFRPRTSAAEDLATDFMLEQNCPNPFNPVTSIGFSLPETGVIHLGVHDIKGRRVATLYDGIASAGTHRVPFDGSLHPSGVYFYTLEQGAQKETRKLLLLK